jgi:hypothetical protein
VAIYHVATISYLLSYMLSYTGLASSMTKYKFWVFISRKDKKYTSGMILLEWLNGCVPVAVYTAEKD